MALPVDEVSRICTMCAIVTRWNRWRSPVPRLTPENSWQCMAGKESTKLTWKKNQKAWIHLFVLNLPIFSAHATAPLRLILKLNKQPQFKGTMSNCIRGFWGWCWVLVGFGLLLLLLLFCSGLVVWWEGWVWVFLLLYHSKSTHSASLSPFIFIDKSTWNEKESWNSIK